jgi:predicted phosphodiesterase
MESHLTEKEERLINLLSRQNNLAVSDADSQLGVSSDELMRIAKSLRDKGYDIRYYSEEDLLILVKEEDTGEVIYPDVKEILDKYRIGVIAEPRLCSKTQRLTILKEAYEVFRKWGVSFIILVGNLTVGKPDKYTQQDIFRKTAASQIDYIVEHFPTAGKKTKTYIVGGRRDLSFMSRQGLRIISSICAQRKDMIYAGDIEVDFPVKGIVIKAMNPFHDNAPKGKSYALQTVADNISEPHPDILLLGGIHKYQQHPDYWYEGGLILGVPSLHAQMRKQRMRKISPDIGFLILEIDFKKRNRDNKPLITHHVFPRNRQSRAILNDYLEPQVSLEKTTLNEDQKKVFSWLSEATDLGLTIGEMARKIKKVPDGRTISARQYIEEILQAIQNQGFTIFRPEDSNRVVLQQAEKKKFSPPQIKEVRVVRSAHISDTHLTSPHQQIKLLREAYKRFARQDIIHVFHAGDGTEGAAGVGYRGHFNDVVLPQYDDVIDYIVERYPRVKKMKTYIISGGHDLWIQRAGGPDPIRHIASRRKDIIYLGREKGSRIVDNIYHYLIHPAGGLGYTLSFKLERHIKAMRAQGLGRGHPKVLQLGNWHQAYALLDDDILGILIPCYKTIDEFHITRAFNPRVGDWILELGLDEAGGVVRISLQYYSQKDQIDENDYADIYLWQLKRIGALKKSPGADNG